MVLSVRPRHGVCRIEPEPVGPFRPGPADEFIGLPAAQGPEPAPVSVGLHEHRR